MINIILYYDKEKCDLQKSMITKRIDTIDKYIIDVLHNIENAEFDDDKGCSIVYIFTDKGKLAFEKIKDKASVIETDSETDIKKAYLLEGAFAEHAIPNKTRTRFFAEFDNKSLEELRHLSIRVKTFQERVLDGIKLIVNKLGIFNIAKKIYKSIK